jgi:hypothetical protein
MSGDDLISSSNHVIMAEHGDNGSSSSSNSGSNRAH